MTNQNGIVMEEVTDPTELVTARAGRALRPELSFVSVARDGNIQHVSG